MKYALLLFIFAILILISINFFASFFKVLIYKPNLNHKEKFKNIIFNTGGLIFFLYFAILYLTYIKSKDLYGFLFLTLIFLVGLFADMKKNFTANLRLLLISLFAILYIVISNNLILDLKFDIINNLFTDYPFSSIFFTSICLVILINGFNFIDGVHGLTLLYGIIVLAILNYFIYFKLGLENKPDTGLIFLPILSLLLVYNFFEKIFFGDSGSYVLGAMIGLYVINLSNLEDYSYPYFYANLLIYPAFEVFFSISRKLINKQGPYKPDQKHLHHLIQKFYQIKFSYNISSSKILCAISINLIILLFNLVSINFYQNKYILICNLFIFIILYTFVYIILNKKTKMNFNFY